MKQYNWEQDQIAHMKVNLNLILVTLINLHIITIMINLKLIELIQLK